MNKWKMEEGLKGGIKIKKQCKEDETEIKG